MSLCLGFLPLAGGHSARSLEVDGLKSRVDVAGRQCALWIANGGALGLGVAKSECMWWRANVVDRGCFSSEVMVETESFIAAENIHG